MGLFFKSVKEICEKRGGEALSQRQAEKAPKNKKMFDIPRINGSIKRKR
jgi:hypothetical protein